MGGGGLVGDYSQQRLSRLERKIADLESAIANLNEEAIAQRHALSALRLTRLPGDLVSPLARSNSEASSS